MDMRIRIENELAAHLKAGAIRYQSLELHNESGLESFINKTLSELENSLPRIIPPGFQFMRRLYRAFRIDPTRHRPSSEALFRRFLNHGEFPRLNPMIDLTNLLSLRFQICYGLYDLDLIQGSHILISLGTEGDSYQGIRKDTLSFNGKIILSDEKGPFGNPSADSLRTSVSEMTRNLLQVLFFHAEDTQNSAILRETSEVYQRFFHIGEIIISSH